MRPALIALLMALSLPAGAGPPPVHDGRFPQSNPPIDAAIQLAQSCVCHNPVGSAGETIFCPR